MQFWQLYQNCFARNLKHSRSEPKSYKKFVSSRNLSLRVFHWTRRIPYWRTCSFLANQSFLRKAIIKYKVVPPSTVIFIKFFLWSHWFCFWHLCENFCHKSGISSFKIRKECQTCFSQKNPFFSKLFSGLTECGVNNSAKNLSLTNQLFFAHCP